MKKQTNDLESKRRDNSLNNFENLPQMYKRKTVFLQAQSKTCSNPTGNRVLQYVHKSSPVIVCYYMKPLCESTDLVE